MSAEERREARRKRILENAEIRLQKIISVTLDENMLNEQVELINNNPGNNSFCNVL